MTLRKTAALAVLSSALLVGVSSMAQELQIKVWASACMNCHGENGKAVGTGVSLAGVPADVLVAKMMAYKSGEAQATVMHQIAKGYTDDQIIKIAGFFASQKK